MVIGNALVQLISIYEKIVFLDIILSWVLMAMRNPGILFTVKSFLDRLVDPALGPIRRIMRPYTAGMMLDFSPIVLFFLLEIVQAVIMRVFGG